MSSMFAMAALARKNLDRRLAPFRNADDLARPPRGWIKAVRESLGMTAAQLATRMGVSQTRVSRLEKDEARAAVTLRTLKEAAEALNCTLVYAFVPNQPLEQMVRQRAAELANERLARAHHTMKLENQALARDDLEAERQRVLRDLVEGDPRRLWVSE